MKEARQLINKVKSYNYYLLSNEEVKERDKDKLFELLRDKIEGWYD